METKIDIVEVKTCDLDFDRYVKMPFQDFINLVSVESCSDDDKASEQNPKVRYFKNIKSFYSLTDKEKSCLDETKDVIVLHRGDFLMFLKNNVKQKHIVKSEENKDEASNPKQDKKVEP